jgi:hypothetical protein
MKRLGLVLAFALVGCGVDPLPEPPSGPPALVGEISGDACVACDGQAKLSGGPGSVTNGDTVWAVDLDQTFPPVEAPVQSDGSFELFLVAFEGDEIRVQARRDERRSTPLDLVMVAQGVLAPAVRPLGDCFVVEPELELPSTGVGQTASQTFRIQHECASTLTIDAIALRAATPDLTVTAPGQPLVLAPSEFIDLSIDFHPGSPDVREEVLLIEVSSPEVDRRAVTLFGLGTP